jgi:hypothetical protein
MSGNLHNNEVYSFFEFLGRRLESGEAEVTPEESVAAFRRYQDELKRLVDESQESLAQADRGESAPLDHTELMKRVRKRFAISTKSD